MKKYDIIVVGGGIAGLTAAIYAKRGGANVLILEREACGGQLLEAPLIENYPGFQPMPGAEIVEHIMKQIEKLQIEIEYEEVTDFSFHELNNVVRCGQKEYSAYCVILATGASHRKLSGIEGPNVSYCPLCDGPFYKDKTVAIIGDGNSALQYCLSLSTICRKIYLCTLTQDFFGERDVIDRVLSLDNVEQVPFVLSKKYENGKLYFVDEDDEPLVVDGVFVAIGQVPNTSIYPVNIMNRNFIGNYNCRTSLAGVYAVGDCREKEAPSQAIISASDGAIAAIDAVDFLIKKSLIR